MIKTRWRICSLLILLCGSLSVCGCFLAYYPDTYDASDFEEFQYRRESDPPCLESPSTSEEDPDIRYGPVCEATITRQATGEYLVLLGVRTDYQSDSPYLPERAMTDSEVERMLAAFGELHINLHPQPFCIIPMAGSPTGEFVYRWDDLELVRTDCDRARLDWRQVGVIHRFLNSLVTTGLSEVAATSE